MNIPLFKPATRPGPEWKAMCKALAERVKAAQERRNKWLEKQKEKTHG